jgi:3-oxoacyl-[acyl-carrier-protein] synthase II
MSNRRRVVVTGMAVISSVGLDLDETWTNLKAGKSGIGSVTQFDTTGFATTIAGEVKGFEPGDYMEKKDARKMARFSQFAVAASHMAAKMAGLEKGNFKSERAGVFLGVGIGGFQDMEEGAVMVNTKGPHSVQPMLIPKLISNEAAGNTAISLGLKGPSCAVTTACSSGTDAAVLAADVIRAGRADIMFTGGTEACITKLAFAGFNKLMAMTTNFNDTPEKASRPFDCDRSGFVMGEGAGVLILEEYEHAKARGADIICEYAGGAMTCDAYHLTSPTPDGSGAKEAFRLALADAGLNPTDIGYINAHATSTPINDPTESKVIAEVFGDYAGNGLLISGTKSMTGHTLGAAGGIEAIVAIKSMLDGFIPPTINLEKADEECTLNYVPNKGVKAEVNAVMSDSLGFGGHNGVICFKKI